MHDEQHILPATINRRALLGGIAGAATLAVGGAALVSAQSATPSATSGSGGSGSSSRGAKLETRMQTELAAVKADRDAVAGKIDTTMVDRLLAFAMDLEGRATTSASGATGTPAATGNSATGATSTSAQTSAMRDLAASGLTGEAARAEILAQLSAFGLPSQKAEVSKLLADTYAAITADAAAIKAANNTDATSALTMAQDLYTSAHDTYGTGLYSQAAKGDMAAGLMLRVAEVLSGQGKLESSKRKRGGAGGAASSRMRDRKQRQKGSKGSNGNSGTAPGGNSTNGTPVAVPSPTF